MGQIRFHPWILKQSKRCLMTCLIEWLILSASRGSCPLRWFPITRRFGQNVTVSRRGLRVSGSMRKAGVIKQTTSIESYHAARDSGLIGRRQWQVLRYILMEEGNMQDGVSQGDCGRAYQDASSSFQPRFQLIPAAIYGAVGTGRTVARWLAS